MLNEKKVILKRGKEFQIKNRHHWIFSGAVQIVPSFEDGEILSVYSSDGECLGHAYFNRNSDIIGRMINFDSTPPLEALRENIKSAISLRNELFNTKVTNCYRLINGEGDCLPGLTVDRYNDTFVMQLSTYGMDRLKPVLIEILLDLCKDQLHCLYEKSTMHTRVREGLKPVEGVLWGTLNPELVVKENDISFAIDLKNSQKTGLFLDMREMRCLIKTISAKKRILNCFSYTGGFSLYAMTGGATGVDTLDISSGVVEQARKNFQINGLTETGCRFIAQDAFCFLREQELSSYDLIILDPPAFAKKKAEISGAKKGYHEINRTTFQKMSPGSLLLTCSCSYFINSEIFEEIIFSAASRARRKVKILQRHRLAGDHPINMYHREIDYLKSLLLFVE